MRNAIADRDARVELARRSGLRGPTAQFLRHLVGMLVAMMAGMAVLGLLVRVGMSSMGYTDGLRPYPELSAVAMTLEMILPMAGWMLFRGHRRAIVAEMSGAMLLPVLGVVALCFVHVLPSTSAPTLAHVIMYPAMLGAMIHRRAEFTMTHDSTGHSAGATPRSDQGTSPRAVSD